MGGVRLWLGLFSGMLGDVLGCLEHSLVMKAMAVNGPVWSGLVDYFADKGCTGSQPYQLASATDRFGNTLTTQETAEAQI
jgi:hypothetical protein